ncbi:acyltransferase family protein [Cryptosporangium sp. NPDC051539]|uniref:acyltransferase family protein n=1 Tax=Cryptosporangium sp. NPDC051539 TaxID=3363962 RepID=UPI003787F474
MTAQTTPARAATGGRDRYFDVLRTACIVWVVVYHIFSDQSWLGFWPAMGLLFAISGSLMVRSLDRGALKTIKNRLQRLLPVLWLAGLIGVPLMFWQGWSGDERPPLWRLIFWIFPLSDPPGSPWAESLTEPLWYMRSIVWFILLSPVLLILFRWYPKTMILIPLGVMVAFGVGKIGFGWSGELGEGVLTDGFTFLSLWLLGFAHREGMLKKIPVWAVVAMGLVLAGVATYWALTHQEEGSYDFNLIPAGQAIYSFGIVLILLRFAPKFSWVGEHKVLNRLITIINGRAMVIYLWHNVAIELSYPLGDKINVWGMGEKIGLGNHGEAVGTAICAVIAVLLTIVGMLAFGWIEDVAAQRRPQLLPKDLGKKNAAAEPAAPAGDGGQGDGPGDGSPAPTSPAPAPTPGMNDSTVTFAAVQDPNGSYPDRRPGWPDERYQPAAYGSPAVPQQPGAYGSPAVSPQPGTYGSPAVPSQPGTYGSPAVPQQPGAYGSPAVPAQPVAYGSPAVSRPPDGNRYERGYDERGRDDRAHGDRASGDRGQNDRRYDDRGYDERGRDDRRYQPGYNEPRHDDRRPDPRYAPSNYDDRQADAYRAAPHDGGRAPDPRRAAPADRRPNGGAAVPPGRQYGAPRRASDRDDNMAWNAYSDDQPPPGNVSSFEQDRRR